MLVGKLIKAGISEEQAKMIAELTWRQHEQKAINRELKEMRKAAEEGSLAVIIDRIKNTSLEKSLHFQNASTVHHYGIYTVSPSMHYIHEASN